MFPELSILAAIGAMICWGFGDFFIQKTTRKIGTIETVAWVGLIGSVLLLPFVLPELPLIFSAENAALFIVSGILYFAVIAINYESLKEGKLSVVETIATIELPVSVALGIVFFSESLSLLEFFIIGIVFLGIILLSVRSFSSIRGNLIEKGVLIAVVSAVGLGFLNFFVAAGSKNVSPLLAIWVPWVMFTAISLLIVLKNGFKKFLRNSIKSKEIVFAAGFLDTIAWLLFAVAVLDSTLSLTVGITESYPAIGLLLGVFINKEKISSHQWLGAIIALGASFSLAFLI